MVQSPLKLCRKLPYHSKESSDTYLLSGSEEENTDSIAESELAVVPAPSPYRFEPGVTTSDSSISSSSEQSDSEVRQGDLTYLYLQSIVASNNDPFLNNNLIIKC